MRKVHIAYRTVALADVAIALSCESDDQMRHLDWHFGRLPISRRPPELSVHLRHDPPARRRWRPAWLDDGPVRRQLTPTTLRLWHEAGPRAVLATDRLVIGGSATPGQQWRAVRQLLLGALSWFFDRRGMPVLHAAMVGRDEWAALVLGATGSGKSTLAAAALHGGWQLFSDDLVVIRRTPRGPAAFGIPKRMSVARDVAHRLGVAVQEIPGDDRGRLMLPAAALSVGWRDIRLLVRADHHDGGGAIARLPHERATAAVIAAFLESDRPASLRRNLRLLAALSARPAVTLAHAADPQVRLARASELLRDAWTHETTVSDSVSRS